MQNKIKTILVTGGAGFIGSNLVNNLLSEDSYEIICLDNFNDFYNPNQKHRNIEAAKNHPRFQLLQGDICDSDFLKKNLNKKIDIIVHLAARAGVRPSILNPHLYAETNVFGTINLLEFARKNNIHQFIFSSSSSVYGINPNFPWSESDHVLNPISPYAATKVACELLGHTYSYLYNIRFIALRFFTVFGPAQRPDLAIYKFYKNIMENKPIPFFGDGSSSRDYTYIDDILKGIRAAMVYHKSSYEVINLGNNHSVTLTELLKAIEKVAGKKALLEKLPSQPGDVPHTFANIERAKKLLGYNPSTDINSGIEAFRKWYLQNK